MKTRKERHSEACNDTNDKSAKEVCNCAAYSKQPRHEAAPTPDEKYLVDVLEKGQISQKRIGQIVRAVNEYQSLKDSNEELLEALTLLETASRRFANGSDASPSYLLKIAERAKASIAKAEGK